MMTAVLLAQTETLETIEAVEDFGDLNGPIAYWGPPLGFAIPIRRVSARISDVPATDRVALDRLAPTLHGRTWSGTAMLMDAAFDAC